MGQGGHRPRSLPQAPVWPQTCWQPPSSCGTRAGNEPKKWPVSDCCGLVAQMGKGLPHLGPSTMFFLIILFFWLQGSLMLPALAALLVPAAQCGTDACAPAAGLCCCFEGWGQEGGKQNRGVASRSKPTRTGQEREEPGLLLSDPSSEPAPGALGPSAGTNGRRAGDGSGHPSTASAGASQRSQGFDVREGTSWTHRGSWGLGGIPRDAWTPPRRTQPGPGPPLLPDLFPPLFFPWNSPPSFGQLLFPSQKGLSVQVSPLPPFPAIVMLKSPGHVSAKN